MLGLDHDKIIVLPTPFQSSQIFVTNCCFDVICVLCVTMLYSIVLYCIVLYCESGMMNSINIVPVTFTGKNTVMPLGQITAVHMMAIWLAS